MRLDHLRNPLYGGESCVSTQKPRAIHLRGKDTRWRLSEQSVSNRCKQTVMSIENKQRDVPKDCSEPQQLRPYHPGCFAILPDALIGRGVTCDGIDRIDVGLDPVALQQFLCDFALQMRKPKEITPVFTEDERYQAIAPDACAIQQDECLV
jgi:hypothetical protein